jgi:hypothetical protein
MGTLVLIGLFAVIGIAFSFGRKMLRMNKDRNQQQLALMFVSAGRSTPIEAAKMAMEIKAFIRNEDWDRVEAFDRMAHTISMVKVMDPGPVYENAVEVWQTLKDEL